MNIHRRFTRYFISNFRFQLFVCTPVAFLCEAQIAMAGLGLSRSVLAVPMTRRACFPPPTNLAADTDSHSLSSARIASSLSELSY